MRNVLIGTGHFQLCWVAGDCWVAVGGFGTAALWCARWPLPREPRGSEPGVLWRAAFAVIGRFSASAVPFCPAKNSPNLAFLEARKDGFPCPHALLLPSFLAIGRLLQARVEDAAGPASESQALNFGSSKSGRFGYSTQQPNLPCLHPQGVGSPQSLGSK